MMQFWRSLVTMITARLGRILVSIRRFASPQYILGTITQKFRGLLNKLLDFRPKHKKDYYNFLGWMISRRLANALVILIGVGCLIYMFWLNPIHIGGSADGSTYRYSSIPLRLADGQVKITAKSGYVAYEGTVKKGYVTGRGTLYNADGQKVYEGEFKENKYNGTGTLYYESGQQEYIGSFEKNLFEGAGTQFHENGAKLYEGAFSKGMKEGEGTLYNMSGSQIFIGDFHLDDIVYTQLLGKTAENIGTIYTGGQFIYESAQEEGSAVVLNDIGVIYYSKGNENSISDSMKSDMLCVGKSTFAYGNKTLRTLEELDENLGKPVYEGNSYLNFLEAVSVNWLQNRGKAMEIDTGIDLTPVFDEVNTVNSYSSETVLYLHTYLVGEQTYTFVSKERTGEFFMYEVE